MGIHASLLVSHPGVHRGKQNKMKHAHRRVLVALSLHTTARPCSDLQPHCRVWGHRGPGPLGRFRPTGQVREGWPPPAGLQSDQGCEWGFGCRPERGVGQVGVSEGSGSAPSHDLFPGPHLLALIHGACVTWRHQYLLTVPPLGDDGAAWLWNDLLHCVQPLMQGTGGRGVLGDGSWRARSSMTRQGKGSASSLPGQTPRQTVFPGRRRWETLVGNAQCLCTGRIRGRVLGKPPGHSYECSSSGLGHSS